MNIDPTTLQTLHQALAEQKSVFLSAGGVNVCFETRILGIQSTEIALQNTILPELIREVMASSSITLQLDMIQLKASCLKTDGVHLLLPIESDGAIPEGRSQSRALTAEKQVFAEILNPIDGVTVLHKKVLDISTGGMSIRAPFESQLLAPGREFPSIKILVNGKVHTETTGTLVYVRKLIDRRGSSLMQAGFKFPANIPEPKTSIQNG